MVVDAKGSITMSMNDDRCECSCHRDGSHHISPCCYTCLRCDTDLIRPINFGEQHCKKCEALLQLTDEELQAIVDGVQGANPRKPRSAPSSVRSVSVSKPTSSSPAARASAC